MPVSVVVLMTISQSGSWLRSSAMTVRVALISPRLTAWIQMHLRSG